MKAVGWSVGRSVAVAAALVLRQTLERDVGLPKARSEDHGVLFVLGPSAGRWPGCLLSFGCRGVVRACLFVGLVLCEVAVCCIFLNSDFW